MSAASDKNEIYISPNPHFSSPRTTQSIMLLVIISLLPLAVYASILFGLSAIITILVSTAACVCFEALTQILFKRPVRIGDGSSVVTGILLALTLPPGLPVWMSILGAFFAIVVAKEFFGGIGSNVFNPALTGRAFLFISFPSQMGSRWVKPFSDTVSSATVLPQINDGSASFSASDYIQYLMGNKAGCIGETSAALIILAAVFLIAARIIDWRTPLAMIAVAAGASFIAGIDAVAAILTGGLLFGAVFMATDYTTTPVTPCGRLIFGAGCALITFLIRKFGGYPEGVMFSILIMNTVAPFLSKITERKYGHPKLFAAKRLKTENGGRK